MPATEENYLLDKQIPGIVEGTAKMVDTEKYFTTNSMKTSSMELNLVCNNSDYLEISVGYKKPTYSLLNARNPEKEITLWSGENNFPTKSVGKSSSSDSKESTLKNRIAKEWDLLSIGFRPEEYLKADERIWFLRIKDTREGPYGYNEITDSVVYNGTRYTQTDYHPNMNYLETFELSFNQVTFKTLFHPFFDGSTEVVVPIRGVDHELTCEDKQTENEIRGQGGGSTWSVSITNPYPDPGDDRWAVVFATAGYDDGDDASYMSVEGCAFILGLSSGSLWRPYGVIDYGWNVAYCMDEHPDGNHSLDTCEKTDDDYLKQMLSFADSMVSSNEELIVFVNCHGSEYESLFNRHGPHRTLSSKSTFNWFYGYSDTMTASAYKNYISDITNGGTYVFLWIDCCHGDGLNTASDWQGYHNNHLRVWAYDPYSYNDAQPLNVSYSSSEFEWITGWEAWCFFRHSYYYNPPTNDFDLDYIGDEAQDQFNLDHPDSEMYIVDCFNEYSFDLKYV
jgi:hypothetical protein